MADVLSFLYVISEAVFGSCLSYEIVLLVVIVGFLRPERRAIDLLGVSNVFLGEYNLFSGRFVDYLGYPNFKADDKKDSLGIPIFEEEPAVNDSAVFFRPNNFGIFDTCFFSFSTSSLISFDFIP